MLLFVASLPVDFCYNSYQILDILYTRTHEWVRAESDARLTIGISDYAQKALGDIVFAELPKVGSKVLKNSTNTGI